MLGEFPSVNNNNKNATKPKMILKELSDLIEYFEYNYSVIQEKSIQISIDSENRMN